MLLFRACLYSINAKIGIDKKFVQPGPRDEAWNILVTSKNNAIKSYSLSLDGEILSIPLQTQL